MFKSGWTVVGLGLLFVVVQSCGDEFGTGRITTPGAAGELEQPPPEQGQAAAPPTVEMPLEPAFEMASLEPLQPEPRPVRGIGAVPVGPKKPEPAWPDYQYDDGSVLWDGAPATDLGDYKWNKGVIEYRGQNGKRFRVNCLADPTEYAVWGMNPFTDDSPVCSAAGLLGLIDRDKGGKVIIEIRPAQRSFVGGLAHGITALPWGPYAGSYRVIP